jgi:hypothetical protein
LTESTKNNHPFIGKVIRLRIAVLLISFVAVTGIIYFYSSESKQPFIGQPKVLNKKLLDQEIENARLLFSLDSLILINKQLVMESDTIDGIVFEVQIGGFEKIDRNRYLSDLEIVNYSENGSAHYITLGKFRDYEDAKLFVSDLNKIGISNTNIASKLNGESVKIRE